MSDALHPWVAEGHGTVRVGVGVSTRAPQPDWPTRLELAEAVEALGFDSLWVPDHPAFGADCWTTLAALAVATRRVRLGPLVSCALYRSPIMTARLAADVDRLSGGRLILGLGIGSFEPEFGLLGLPAPPVAERFAALRETVESVRRLWTGEPFYIEMVDGRYQPTGSGLRPGPVQQPSVPVLIGGGGERVTLRLVAELADMCNLDATVQRLSPEDVGRKYAALRAHCERVGRPYRAIVRSHLLNPVILAPTPERLEAKLDALSSIYRQGSSEGLGTPRDLIGRYRPIVEAGAEYLIVNLATYEDVETLELLAEQVVPALPALARA